MRALRTGQAEDWSRQKLKYVSEIIDLMRVISDDEIFDNMAKFIEETQKEKGGVNVCEFVQKMKNEGRIEGISLGRSEGISLGISQGWNNHARESARIAISMGLTKEQAAKISGLSVAEIEKLQ